MAVTTQEPVEVFVAAAADAWHDVQALRAHDAVRLVPTPRHATVLLIAGAIPDAHREALDRVHDQIPHPRATVIWEAAAANTVGTADFTDDVVAAIVAAAAGVMADPSASSPDRLADAEPNAWRGVGPFGQGGEGMMGGTPYGRPMAMTADDRDGLALDQLAVRLGPFLGQLPGGLVADVALQGEVIQQIRFACPGDAVLVDGDRERTVTRRLLWLSHALHVEGLDAHAVRVARLARRSGRTSGDENGDRYENGAGDLLPEFLALRRRLRWTGLRSSLRGVGEQSEIDTWTRWTSHLDAIIAGLESAGSPSASAETPVITADELAAMLTGLTLTDAVTAIVGFDLDVPATMAAEVDS